ncbi:hypothetical protein JCM3770_004225 [Rhodotorula araucariae]
MSAIFDGVGRRSRSPPAPARRPSQSADAPVRDGDDSAEGADDAQGQPQRRKRQPVTKSADSQLTQDSATGPAAEHFADSLSLLAATATPQLSDGPFPTFHALPDHRLHSTSAATLPVAGPLHLPALGAPLASSSTSQARAPPSATNAAFFPAPAQLLNPSQPPIPPAATTASSSQSNTSFRSPGSQHDSTPGETFPRPSAKQSAAPPSSREPNPVDQHILTELQAAQLFEHYHSKMKAFIILLDQYLHSMDYCRRNSTVLFASVLAVSAKFLRPDLYPSLISTAKHLVGRGIVDGKVTLGLVQSILLLVYWKEPADRSAWLRIGEAIRIGASPFPAGRAEPPSRLSGRTQGYPLHLHEHRTTPLPADELEVREIMDRERTWIDLCAFDQSFCFQGGEENDYQACMVPHIRCDVRAWLDETKRFGVTDDLEQGANFDWMKIQRLSKDSLLDATNARYLEPSSPDAFAVGTRAWIRVNFWLSAASLAFARAMITALGIDSDTTAAWVVASGSFVDAFEIVARHGYIAY